MTTTPVRRNLAPLFSSEDITWNTPPSILEPVRRFRTIDLDPCSNSRSVVAATEEWQLERDGDSLAKTWGQRFAFVNPPYGRHLPAWMTKCSEEAAKGTEIVALVPSRTDTKWFGIAAASCSAICFWRGRWKSPHAKHSAPFPSVLIYWGHDVRGFHESFSAHGLIWVLR